MKHQKKSKKMERSPQKHAGQTPFNVSTFAVNSSQSLYQKRGQTEQTGSSKYFSNTTNCPDALGNRG
jgi:hypothetical protein